MIPLLELALDAHGGLTRWRQAKSIDLKLSIGGPLWHAKGLPQSLNVALHVEPSRKLVVASPFDGEDSTGYFTPDRVWVENAAGTVVQELTSPRRSFSGHDLMTPWSKLQENGRMVPLRSADQQKVAVTAQPSRFQNLVCCAQKLRAPDHLNG